MAPELLNYYPKPNNARRILANDKSTDVYSLGVVLGCIMLHTLPHREVKNQFKLRERVGRGELPFDLNRLLNRDDLAVYAAIKSALERDPSLRPTVARLYTTLKNAT